MTAKTDRPDTSAAACKARSLAMVDAYKSHRIEGLEPSNEGRKIHRAWIAGEVTGDEARAMLGRLYTGPDSGVVSQDALAMASDPYTDANGVMLNKHGIQDAALLDRAETDYASLRLAELKLTPIQGKFDRAHLNAVHAFVFQDTYAWAGQTRTVDIQKGDSPFARVDFIESSVDKLLTKLGRENHLKGLDQAKFVDRAAYYLSELNSAHPYREGNGRATRAFVEQIGKQAGHELSLNNMSREMINTSAERAHLSGDHRHLVPLIERSLQAAQQSRGIER